MAKQNIIISNSLEELVTADCKGYVAHALCLSGSCHILYNGESLDFQNGDLLIVRKISLIEEISPTDNFCVKVVYLRSEFIELCTPRSNYGMKGAFLLFLNPVMHLNSEQKERCKCNFELLEQRLYNTEHHFHNDMLIATIQMTILDFYDFHSHLYDEKDITTQNASIMWKFLDMLEQGTFRKHREVTYYADNLCVSSKYLSEVSKKVSGHSANYWINRYTALDISRLLRNNKNMTFVQISDIFGFSSQAYFSRYVQQHLGISPTKYRG